MTFDTALAGSGIVAASISGTVAEAMFARSAIRQDARRRRSRRSIPANPHVAGFAIAQRHGDRSHHRRAREADRAQRRRLPAGDGADGRRRKAVGRARRALRSSRARRERQLARATRRTRAQIHLRRRRQRVGHRRRCSRSARRSRSSRATATCCWHSGRAKSSACSARRRLSTTPPVPLDQMAAYLNFDMVGRMQDNKLTVQATGTSPVVGADARAGQHRAPDSTCRCRQDPYQPTDVASFNQAGVPSLNFFTGTHVDYHRPTDTADKIDYEDLDRVVDFAAAIAAADRRLDAAAAVHQGRSADRKRRRARRRPRLHRHDSRLRHRGQGSAAERRHRRRPGRAGRAAEGRRHRRDRRADDRQHLRLHLRARGAEDWRAGEGRLSAGRPAEGDDVDAGGEKVAVRRTQAG